MDFDREFIPQAIRTESVPEVINASPVGLHTVLATAYQLSLVTNEFKRAIYYSKPANMQRVANAILAVASGVSTIVETISKTGGDAERFVTDNSAWLDSVDEIAGTSEEMESVALTGVDPRVLHAVLGVSTEAAELSVPLFKTMNGEAFDIVNFGEEFGDIDWYKAVALDAVGLSSSNIQHAVIAKLKKRYPEKFNSESAVNRDLNGERAILEQGIVEQ